LTTKEAEPFINELQQFATRTSLIGALNSLVQTTLKATIPGIPDFYQGTEFWDLSLVDPDNRRPVDFSAPQKWLNANTSPRWTALAADWQSGHVKLAWTRHLLEIRNRAPSLFSQGEYIPLEVSGGHAAHCIAFARASRNQAAVVIALRQFALLTDRGRRWPQFHEIDATVKTARLAGFEDATAVRESLGELPANVIVHRK
jgi:(1->4)-alpha-D-glucan 1-alpha-D-glucosylmutase